MSWLVSAENLALCTSSRRFTALQASITCKTTITEIEAYIEGDGLALAIAVEPEYKLIGVTCVLLNVLDHVLVVLDHNFLELN